MQKILLPLRRGRTLKLKKDFKYLNSSYPPLDFIEVMKKANNLANIIEEKFEELAKILLTYESYEVVQDETNRTLDLLRNLHENKKYFQIRVGAVTAFLPRNQPLYAFACFVVVPSLMASEVHFRVPHSMKAFFPKMLEVLGISEQFPNIFVSKKERLDFLKERSALFVDTQTKETWPATEAVIFTGLPHHADQLRIIFDKRTLFITNGAGHNPVVVSKDADLTKAVEAVLTLQFYNQGQDCAAPNSILVHKEVASKFMKVLREKVANTKVCNYEDKSCRVGPISDPQDLVRIQNFLVENREWLDNTTPGIIRAKDSIVEPAIIYRPLSRGGNYKEIFAPIVLVQEYSEDIELKNYFETKQYAYHAMYLTLYGTSEYVKNLVGKSINGKILHDQSTFLHNTHLHAKGVERGTEQYGGYGYGASSISINGKVVAMPTLPQRDIYTYLAKPFLKNNKGKIRRIQSNEVKEVQEKNVEKLLRLRPSNGETQTNGEPKQVYVDVNILQQKKHRYAKLSGDETYLLLNKPNAEYVAHLKPNELQLIQELKKLLAQKGQFTPEEFRHRLYAIPKDVNETPENNAKRQKSFFSSIYQLLFATKSGPQLASFLHEADSAAIDRLLQL